MDAVHAAKGKRTCKELLASRGSNSKRQSKTGEVHEINGVENIDVQLVQRVMRLDK